MRTDITPYAKLIAALAETMSDSDWATEITTKCDQIEKAAQMIRSIVAQRFGSER